MGNIQDVVVVGGGLAGLSCARRASRDGRTVTVIDSQLPDTKGNFGGFAQFSGAKFSLPPAGMGLVSRLGSHEQLFEAITDVMTSLGLSDKLRPDWRTTFQVDQKELGAGVRLRRYECIVVNPQEMRAAIGSLVSDFGNSVTVTASRCASISRRENVWQTELLTSQEPRTLRSKTVVLASGRTTSQLSLPAGLELYEGKGIDLGIRFEFDDRSGFSRLAELGSDAKLLRDSCRTFCVNSPGEVYRYAFGDLAIAGGRTLSEPHRAGNFGILCRRRDKAQRISQLQLVAKSPPPELTSVFEFKELYPRLKSVFGDGVAAEVTAFARALGEIDLVDWSACNRVHFPLLDWHWNTYRATPQSPGVFICGDLAGDARGILQAAVSGWCAAGECSVYLEALRR